MVDWLWKQARRGKRIGGGVPGAFFLKHTRREKRAYSAAINLFFGALLGANLGTAGTLPLSDYIFLVILLVGTVTTIHMSVVSERRGYMAALVLLYVMLFVLLYLRPESRPAMPEEDMLKLLATLAIWFGSATFIEFIPTVDPPARTPPPDEAAV